MKTGFLFGFAFCISAWIASSYVRKRGVSIWRGLSISLVLFIGVLGRPFGGAPHGMVVNGERGVRESLR